MKTALKLTAIAGAAAMLLTGSTNTFGQEQQQPQQRQGGGGGGGGGRGNFDPEQMRQRQMERYREQMDVKDDAEWKLIQDRIEKVSAARRELGTGGAAAFGFGRGGGGRGPGGGGDNAGGGGGGGGGRRGFGADPLPEAEALQKAIEAKASNDELKGKLTKLRDARKDKEAKLEKAQDELRKVLSVRQEAVAVVSGLLK